MGMFTLLSALGTEGSSEGGLWATSFFLNQCGQMAFLIPLINFFVFLDPLNMYPKEDKPNSWKSLFCDIRLDHAAVASLVGFSVSGGYAMVYYASETVPFPIIDGLLSGETMIAFFLSYFVWGEYGNPGITSMVSILVILGSLIYATGILILALLAFQ